MDRFTTIPNINVAQTLLDLLRGYRVDRKIGVTEYQILVPQMTYEALIVTYKPTTSFPLNHDGERRNAVKLSLRLNLHPALERH